MRNKLPLHHVPGGGYRNLPGYPKPHATRGDMYRFLYKQLTSVGAPAIPANHVLPQTAVSARLAAAGNPSVTWLGHATFIIRIAGKTILTDPFLGETAGPYGIGPKRFVPAAMTAEELPPIDVMIVSHNHYDHLDANTIESYRHKDTTQVIVPLGLGDFFTNRGYPHVLEQDWWQKWRSDGLTITTLPAVHFSGRGLFDRNKTLWASFAIESPTEKIWFSGDTAYGDVFSEIGDRCGPFDIALIAIGAYEPRPIMRSVHASPEEAIDIAIDIGAKQAIGMHWGTIRLTPENPFEAPDRFRQAADEKGFGSENARVLQIGETRSIPHIGEEVTVA